MKSIEHGQEKIQKICDKIRHQTIEPAKEEAQKIIELAHVRAKEIISQAEQQAEQYIKQAKGQIEQEKNVFHSSLQQASKQTVEFLRQEIEHHLFNEELQSVLEKQLSDPRLIAELINGLVKAIEREGLSADLSAVIPRAVSADDVSALLLDSVRKKLKMKPLELGSFGGGAQVRLNNKKMTLDLSDQTIKELLANYVRKDFRQLIFSH
jgi:V/A-type H+-transporting ATPase subunit E